MILKRLIAYLLPHQGWFWLAFSFLVLATAADMGATYLITHFLDHQLLAKQIDGSIIFYYALGYISLQIGAALFSYYQRIWLRDLSNWAIRDMRKDLFAKVQRFALSFFDRTPTGKIVSRITNDTENIVEFYLSVLSYILYDAVFVIGIYVTLFLLDVQLAIIMLFILPIYISLIVLFQKRTHRAFKASRQKISQMNTQLNESIQSMNIIQAFLQEATRKEQFSQLNDAHYQASRTILLYEGLFLRPATRFLSHLSIIFMLLYFGNQSFGDSVQIGVVYGFFSLMMRLVEPLSDMMMLFTRLQQSLVSAERVFAMLDHEEPAPTSRETEKSCVIHHGKVEFRGVSFSYDGKNKTLQDISFTVMPGQTVALVGDTGSGKSTITNLLLRFYLPQSGEILIDDQPLDKISDKELRQKVGYVLQEPFLFYGDIKKNIRLHQTEISEEAVREAARFVQVDKMINSLPQKYNEMVRERGANFSSGQRQLLSFARTMVREPKILILDEATASVDTETEELIQQSLEAMRKGRTTIAIAHRLSTIEGADLILVLSRGKIVERGAHQELLEQKGLYYQMYRLQSGSEGSKI